MILTCPECATSYFVDAERIPEAGRTVKCASCGARWTAKRETGEFRSADDQPAQPPTPAPEPAAARTFPQDAPPDDMDIVEVQAEETSARARPARAQPAPRPARHPDREARGKVVVWVAAASLVVALVAGAIVMRSQVVKFWPKSQAAYAGLGLPVNSVGLVIEGVQATPTFLGGRPVLSVTGDIRNVRGETVNAPALRVNLLNRSGKAISARIVRPIDPRVPAGATRHFAIAISDPPSNAQDLEVVFEAGQQTAVSPPAPAVSVPVDAQPLPAGSPGALTDHG